MEGPATAGPFFACRPETIAGAGLVNINMSRPVIWISIAIAGILLVLLMPPLLQRRAVTGSANAIAEAVRNEDMNALALQIMPTQRAMARKLIEPLLPGHGANLHRFRVISMDRMEDGSYQLDAIFNFEDQSWGRQIVEARLVMRPDAGSWLLDLSETEARQFSLSDGTDWTRATDWLNLAQP